jgi:tetratricopeptide (TPR) repeat protein
MSAASEPKRVATSLAAWGRAIDRSIAGQASASAARMAGVVLGQLPRHLPTYHRLLALCWAEERWREGEEWARRLLQADPGNARAWRAMARAAESEDRRAEAHIIWRRAFEMSPYDPDIRTGLNRTSLDPPHALSYNLACLATIYLRGRRWGRAADAYRRLAQADRRRVDFQVALAVSLWQSGQDDEAYTLARHLIERHTHLLMAWYTLAATGDENDRALAESPIATMDPDGEYAASIWGVGVQDSSAAVLLTPDELDVLEYRFPEPSSEDEPVGDAGDSVFEAEFLDGQDDGFEDEFGDEFMDSLQAEPYEPTASEDRSDRRPGPESGVHD